MIKLFPKLLWDNFFGICEVPRPSHHEEKIQNYLVDWAKKHNLSFKQDEVGNILIKKPASKGMESKKSIALQAHMDMVPQKTPDSFHNFLEDPIIPRVENGWVKATNTTLGADNGIGLAAILAVFESKDMVHPEIEGLITVTEEDGMDGASALKNNFLESKLMLNLDTEILGDIYVGCAGGVNLNISTNISYEEALKDGYTLSVSGLRGGHSGCDIHTDRINAIFVLFNILQEVAKIDLSISTFEGGSVRNAIPRDASSSFVTSLPKEKIEEILKSFKDKLSFETSLEFSLENTKITRLYSKESYKNFITLMSTLPNGVVSFSNKFKGVVDTSLSMGLCKNYEEVLEFIILVRSLNEEHKASLMSDLESICLKSNSKAIFSDNYPGWDPDNNSSLTKLVANKYEEILERKADIKVIHAGLECGFVKSIYPEMDIVSFGPTIINAHSPDEAVNIESVKVFWDTLCKILENSPAK
ncbi:MAG: beta-Ala-His dipeptidase [Psittacicella sp.]